MIWTNKWALKECFDPLTEKIHIIKYLIDICNMLWYDIIQVTSP